MKDLKHIHYFTRLLEQANNELVREATSEGRHALGYTCYFIPEVLLNLGSAFSTRLRAPNTGSLDVSTYYMSSFLCGYSKAILERAIEGGYNHLSAFISSETCSEMNRTVENIELLKAIPNEKFFVTLIDVPFKVTEHGLKHYMNQLYKKVLVPLNEQYGIDISDDAIRKAVEEHNEVCDLITEIAKFKEAENPVITGTEFHILNLVSYVCPKDMIIDKLRETLEELKTRQPDVKNKFRARVVVVGSEMDDYGFTELMEECGAYVAADRFCFGSLPGREHIYLKDDESPLYTIAKHYMDTSQCPRYMSKEKVDNRKIYVKELVEKYHADGVIYEQLKFCEYWGYERAIASHIMTNEFGIPSITVDREYTVRGSGQLKTRVQAFVESLEIKKIQRQRGSNNG